jgi:hypothetical protein
MIAARTDKEKQGSMRKRGSLYLNKALRVGGTGQHLINWNRFFRPVTMQLVNSISQEMIAWVMDLMLNFIQDVILKSYKGFKETNFKYVLHVYSKTGQPLRLDSRVDPDTQYERYAAFAFLVTIEQYSGSQPTGVIFVEDNNIDVFMPFPDAMKYDPSIMLQVENALNVIRRDWSHLNRKAIVKRVFKFPDNFTQSNLWTPYFILLRLKYPFSVIQDIFLNQTLHGRLQEKAFYSYFWMSKLISNCVKQAAEGGDRGASGTNGAYEMYFSSRSKLGLSVDGTRLSQLRKMFAKCKLSESNNHMGWINDLLPVDVTSTSGKWPSDVDSKWKNFIPVVGATNAVYRF